MHTLIIVLVAFVAGVAAHAIIVKYLKATEVKAEAEAKSLIASAEAEAKKL